MRNVLRLMLGSMLFLGGASHAGAEIACRNRDALGTSRVLGVGTEGGLAVGLKTYPQTLALADHEVVLTFDDGPLPSTTTRVLDALREECVRATFFLIGRNAAQHPDLVRRELAEGHTVGHHSWSHPGITLRGLSDVAARREIERGIAADETAGWGGEARAERPHVPFFRFPGFADTGALLGWLASRDIAVFGADLWASDWLPMEPQAELKLVLARLERVGRGIILFHDTRAQTAAMLPDFLAALKARGYRVVHIVPAAGRSTTVPAPAGWTSETERSLETIMPHLLARRGRPQTEPFSTERITQEPGSLLPLTAPPGPGTPIAAP